MTNATPPWSRFRQADEAYFKQHGEPLFSSHMWAPDFFLSSEARAVFTTRFKRAISAGDGAKAPLFFFGVWAVDGTMGADWLPCCFRAVDEHHPQLSWTWTLEA